MNLNWIFVTNNMNTSISQGTCFTFTILLFSDDIYFILSEDLCQNSSDLAPDYVPVGV